jgi:hypothetical protein
LKEGEQFPDRSVAVQRITERQVAVHFVSVTAPLARLREVAGLDEVIDDLGSRPLGQTNNERNVPQSRRWIAGDCFQDAGVVSHEPPAVVAIFRAVARDVSVPRGWG